MKNIVLLTMTMLTMLTVICCSGDERNGTGTTKVDGVHVVVETTKYGWKVAYVEEWHRKAGRNDFPHKLTREKYRELLYDYYNAYDIGSRTISIANDYFQSQTKKIFLLQDKIYETLGEEKARKIMNKPQTTETTKNDTDRYPATRFLDQTTTATAQLYVDGDGNVASVQITDIPERDGKMLLSHEDIHAVCKIIRDFRFDPPRQVGIDHLTEQFFEFKIIARMPHCQRRQTLQRFNY